MFRPVLTTSLHPNLVPTRHNEVTTHHYHHGPMGLRFITVVDICHLRSVIQPSAQLWLVARAIHLLLKMHKGETVTVECCGGTEAD